MKHSKKITLVGPYGVGKSSLFRRFIDNSFSEDYQSTIGVQIKKKVITLDNGIEISLILWDTEGEMNINDSKQSYLMGSHTFVYIFDLTRIDTFSQINTQLDFLTNNFPKIPVKVVGNKIDSVFKTKVKKTLEEHKINYDILTSAKTGEHVEELFAEIARELSN